jgi:hypothetical protein
MSPRSWEHLDREGSVHRDVHRSDLLALRAADEDDD